MRCKKKQKHVYFFGYFFIQQSDRQSLMLLPNGHWKLQWSIRFRCMWWTTTQRSRQTLIISFLLTHSVLSTVFGLLLSDSIIFFLLNWNWTHVGAVIGRIKCFFLKECWLNFDRYFFIFFFKFLLFLFRFRNHLSGAVNERKMS